MNWSIFGNLSAKALKWAFWDSDPKAKTSFASEPLPLVVTRHTLPGSDIAQLQGEIAEWANSTIPDRTAYSTVAKLLEEIGELIASERMSDPQELADVAILVLDLFYLQEVDMVDAVRSKMMVNVRRNWRIADNGSAKHV